MQYHRDYWNQIANPWVSAAVLTGGLVSAILLYSLVHLSASTDISSAYDYTNDPTASVLLN